MPQLLLNIHIHQLLLNIHIQ